MSKLGQRLIAAAEEALVFGEGHDTGAVRHDVPDVRAVRSRLGLTQPDFAARFGLPVGNVRDWEQGRVVPDRAAQVLLRVIVQAPQVVARAAACRPTASKKAAARAPAMKLASSRKPTAKKAAALSQPAASQAAARKPATKRFAAKPAARRPV